jgi:hypothetical protein
MDSFASKPIAVPAHGPELMGSNADAGPVWITMTTAYAILKQGPSFDRRFFVLEAPHKGAAWLTQRK